GADSLLLASVQVLFVFVKEDAQYNALKWASEKMHYEYRLACSMDEAVESYLNVQPHLVFIDARSKTCVDPIALCRTLRGFRGSQFSCIVAVVKKGLAEKEEAAIIPLLKSGFNRVSERRRVTDCQNEFSLHYTELPYRAFLSEQSVFIALCSRERGPGIASSIEHSNSHSPKKVSKYRRKRNSRVILARHLTASAILRTTSFERQGGISLVGTSTAHRQDRDIRRRDTPAFVTSFFAASGPLLMHEWNRALNARQSETRSRHLCQSTTEGSGCALGAGLGMNRRQSFAKFHAMTIEAPITKVINMLVATQENSPVFVVQALDRVLEILRSTELYNPQLGVGQGKSEDQMTSDLVSGLITVSHLPRVPPGP
ncbi:unnamed protein product, partial [Ixodes pacificus]